MFDCDAGHCLFITRIKEAQVLRLQLLSTKHIKSIHCTSTYYMYRMGRIFRLYIANMFVIVLNFFFQVKWSAKVMSGAGKSTGETTELVNSYLSRLGPVTRNSCKAGQSCVNIIEI